jgi:hypothetical protein
VQDANGNRATTTVTSDENPQLKVTPSVVTMPPSQATQAFAVSGGTAPYTWSVSDGSLGSITFVSNDMATYTRSAKSGPNHIRVRDAAGFEAGATANQTE